MSDLVPLLFESQLTSPTGEQVDVCTSRIADGSGAWETRVFTDMDLPAREWHSSSAEAAKARHDEVVTAIRNAWKDD